MALYVPSQIVPGTLIVAHFIQAVYTVLDLSVDDLLGEACCLFDHIVPLVPGRIVANIFVKQLVNEAKFLFKELVCI